MKSENNNIVYTFENISGFEFNSMIEIRDAIKECAQYAGFAVSTRSYTSITLKCVATYAPKISRAMLNS